MADHSIHVHENDILMGRGGHNHQHDGNEQLRRMARDRVNDYRRASKKQKAVISVEILTLVQNLDPPGRFLRKNSATGQFEEVRKQEAREKVCQTLRDAVSEMTAARTTSVERNGSDQGHFHLDGDDEDDDEEEDEKMPLLPIKEEVNEGQPMHYEYSGYYAFSTTMQSLDVERTASNHFISPDRTSGSTAVITPTNQILDTPTNQILDIEPVPDNVPSSVNETTDPPPTLMIPGYEMYDSYNYLSRVSIHDDFDLFDGELLKSAMHDEVFASMRLPENE